MFFIFKNKLMTSGGFFDKILLRGCFTPPEGNMSEPNEIASH